ncbi:SDR family NAD(P)-dependent oxidoreductase [Rhodococcus sp. NPDC127528]|uniref:SDR family NAD(P)-dependent oxidoreductase n=1 Tax=unclassified Rhodococcus (in: high G+C Gram-positive bacteria) TaxID=192944 RepID=UPI00363EB2CB
MNLDNASAVVTGGASGLGLATAEAFVARGVPTVIVDLPNSAGREAASALGEAAVFVPADVRDSEALDAALARAEGFAPLRAVVHCAGRGGAERIVGLDGRPGDLDKFRDTVAINLVGSFNVLRLAAARMARSAPVEGERGVVVMTSSDSAFEGNVGQAAYASAKAGIVGLTLVAARDVAARCVRVVTIAPGIFETPILAGVPERVRRRVASEVPFPSRLGAPEEFARLALAVVDNPMINGETIRIDGALRMSYP